MQRARELKQDEKVAALTKRQYIIAPRLNPEPPERLYLSVANDLRYNRKFQQAREYYEKVLRSKALLARRQSHGPQRHPFKLQKTPASTTFMSKRLCAWSPTCARPRS
ncbi:MAG: hypothetical protein HC883_05585 [Bdellovibrionaceae bacterium]|nr:hypothetical protein [Pseudobdellovibrionaceae bacterium]